MREKPFDKSNINREWKEGEPKGREIDIYFFRHGQATGEGEEAGLTELGRQQAREAAEALLQQVREKGGVVKFLSSSTRRAAETGEIMEEYIKNTLSERNITNLRLLSPRQRSALKAAGVIGPLEDRGIEDPIEYWLTHPDVLEGKSPEEVSNRVKKMLRIIGKVADRLPPGEQIHYVATTHEGPQAALLFSATGQTLNELGGRVNNCESFKVHFEGKSEKPPTIQFRNTEAEVVI